MEIDERFLTLLTPEGEFLKARRQKQDYLIGEEINFFPVSIEQRKKSLFLHLLPGKALTAVAIAAIVIIGSFLPFYGNNDVYAYMSIDVNPSIELAVNNDLKVIDMEAFNDEGKKVLAEIDDWKRHEVSNVANQIIGEMKKQGYLQKQAQVVISTVYDDKKEMKTEKKLAESIQQIETKINQENLQLTVIEATKEDREVAHKQGIAPGVYKEQKQKQKSEKDKNQKNSDLNDQKSNNSKADDKDQVEKDNNPSDKLNPPGKTKDDKIKQKEKGKAVAPGQAKKEEKQNKGKNDSKNSEKEKKTSKTENKEIDAKSKENQKNNKNGKNKDKGNKKQSENKGKKKENDKGNKNNKNETKNNNEKKDKNN
jgi:hypothetical protein